MNTPLPCLAWFRSGLFWRTFFLLAFLLAASMAAWVASFRMVEQTPRANQIAAQIISIVTITRTALTHSAPQLRRELLFDLASNEGIRIYPLEATDRIEPILATHLMQTVKETVQYELGENTQFARNVNGIAGFWVSFAITDDQYWLMLEKERIKGITNVQWAGWIAVTLLLSLLGAVIMSALINQPLARLATAARSIANGHHIPPLPEQGAAEIRETNRSFNQMVSDLERVDSDRTLVLAGISHDLRTPLARMQLEVELADLPHDARQGMQADLEQMDAIIGQFLDYAKPADETRFSRLDFSALLRQYAENIQRLSGVVIQTDIAKDMNINGDPVEIKRILNNLVENAQRYGRRTPDAPLQLELCCHASGDKVILEFGDHGTGVPEEALSRLLRPFARVDQARSQANGAGLGLAIIERIVKRHGGFVLLKNRESGGLVVHITLPVAKK